MERKSIVFSIIWAIIAIIGFLIMILASSPPWAALLGHSLGVASSAPSTRSPWGYD